MNLVIVPLVSATAVGGGIVAGKLVDRRRRGVSTST
jgi:hypothetical protein